MGEGSLSKPAEILGERTIVERIEEEFRKQRIHNEKNVLRGLRRGLVVGKIKSKRTISSTLVGKNIHDLARQKAKFGLEICVVEYLERYMF